MTRFTGAMRPGKGIARRQWARGWWWIDGKSPRTAWNFYVYHNS